MTNSSYTASDTASDTPISNGILAYLGVSGAVVLLMMLLGLLMLLTQGGMLDLPPDLFYQVMTAHGIGMVGISSLAGAAIMWHFLSQYVRLSNTVLMINLALFLLGVAMILCAVFLGGFASAWTFLYPLPAISGGAWENSAAAVYLGGVLVIGAGFLLFFLDVGRAILAVYSNLGDALGWPQLIGRGTGESPPPTVVAATMVTIINVLAIVCGAVILTISLVNLYVPAFALDPLLAKNLIYFFGHTFINATIYMAVIVVYELLPRYADRPWNTNPVFLAAWNASLVMVLLAFFHHLLMDFVMPSWLLVLAQVISWLAGLPIIVVTAFGALMIVYRSGINWDVASGLVFVSMFGWATGVLPAIIDATIVVNTVMHNTYWVPGHFHFYLLLGLTSMVFAFLYWLGKGAGRRDGRLDRIAFWAFLAGGIGMAMSFLNSGNASVPRRWAVHWPEWIPYDRFASICATIVILATLVFVWRFLGRLRGIGVAA